MVEICVVEYYLTDSQDHANAPFAAVSRRSLCLSSFCNRAYQLFMMTFLFLKLNSKFSILLIIFGFSLHYIIFCQFD